MDNVTSKFLDLFIPPVVWSEVLGAPPNIFPPQESRQLWFSSDSSVLSPGKDQWCLPTQATSSVLSWVAWQYLTYQSSKISKTEISPLLSSLGNVGALAAWINHFPYLGNYGVSPDSMALCWGQELWWEDVSSLLTRFSESGFEFSQGAGNFQLFSDF